MDKGGQMCTERRCWGGTGLGAAAPLVGGSGGMPPSNFTVSTTWDWQSWVEVARVQQTTAKPKTDTV